MIDLIITDAVVRTMTTGGAVAEAVAVAGNKIAAVGATTEIEKLTERGTRVIDAKGRLLLPGFNDAHVHFLAGGFRLSSIDLTKARTQEEFTGQVREFAAKTPAGSWILGGGWNHELWPGAALPEKGWIDEFTPQTAVLTERSDAHMALANSFALKLAGVTRDTPDPPGGLIVRDAGGEPTGILKDAAMWLVERFVPEPSFDEKLAAGAAASKHAARLGVTSVQDMSANDDLGVFEELIKRGELRTRIYGMRPLPEWEALAKRGVTHQRAMLRNGGLKGFSDGSLGSSTALFFEPYEGSDFCGLPAPEMFPEGAMFERVVGADARGLQVIIHAIGDKANDQILTMFERVNELNGARERRNRIEHAQHLRPQDVPRFARAGVIGSMQPYHLADDGCWAERRIGAERCKMTYAFRSLLDAGATLAFGSDWPIAPLSALGGIGAAVTRQTLDGKNPGGWQPEQKITVEEAARGYTVGAAYAEFQEGVKGMIAPGMLADLVLLERDIFEIDPAEIWRTRVDLTVTDGRVVYERGCVL